MQSQKKSDKIPDLPWYGRRQRVEKILDRCGAEALFATDIKTVRYLSGFTGSSAAMLITKQAAWFLTDGRYETQAGREVTGAAVLIYKKRLDLLESLLKDEGIKTIAFEGRNLSYTEWAELEDRFGGVALKPLKDETRRLRSVKEPGEIEVMRRGAGLAKEVFLSVRPLIVPGAVEREISLAIETEAKRRGAEKVSFDVIVASGARSALPHAVPTGKRIEKGDLVIVDFGVVLDGYHTDETCTLIAGEVRGKTKEIYDVVLEAHDRAIDGIRPGMQAKEVDRLAREFIKVKGYGNRFGHGTGHGVGLEIHELPVISETGEDTLEEGMVFTVEPGVYLPELGGVRIEDMVLVTARGAEIITKCNNILRG